jgi:uncharacterized membrane protein YcaP (DUF421 family)
MEAILRSAAIYLALVILFRLSGKRTLAQITTFDLVLLLIISEATQQALVGRDYSLTNALLVILTLIGIDRLLGLWKQHSKRVSSVLDGTPLVLIEDGELHRRRMDKECVDEEEILHAAREQHGLERLAQVKHAVLEQSGGISIVPKEGEG